MPRRGKRGSGLTLNKKKKGRLAGTRVTPVDKAKDGKRRAERKRDKDGKSTPKKKGRSGFGHLEVHFLKNGKS